MARMMNLMETILPIWEALRWYGHVCAQRAAAPL